MAGEETKDGNHLHVDVALGAERARRHAGASAPAVATGGAGVAQKVGLDLSRTKIVTHLRRRFAQ